uniref:Interferon-induced GTP-binding protein Mx1 n=1 Tax=Geotrypetes seraphini TaxID=260995 RepID=A0A6P8QPW8_GEOSA|nr:interferon-induced GTP-binding protein Mx1 [Geotrypetes seraphini]
MENYLNNAYEQKIRPCIDLIDGLRSLGIQKELALPAITVIGDQGSGKSSVLEALSGVALPRGTGIVTRCPLELKLKKAKNGQKWSGKISYEDVKRTLRSSSEVEYEIIKAQNAIAGEEGRICENVISLEIISPDVPDLTLIDLPGIVRVAVGNQPENIGTQIKKLIQNYIEKQETIILVVAPCNVDIATIEALAIAHEVDPNGKRTLGILTKPDLVDGGSENLILETMRNSKISLNKGYMIVKCRGQQAIHDNLSLKDAVQEEEEFFKKHKHFSPLLDDGKATIPILAEKLTTELVEHIHKSLPDLVQQINSKLKESTEELEHFGTGIPESNEGMYNFLLDKIRPFNKEILSLIKGEENLSIPNTSRLFKIVRQNFELWQKLLDDNSILMDKTVKDKLLEFDGKYRGRELPGFINYQTFEMIVNDYIQKLRMSALENVKSLIHIIEDTFLKYSRKHFAHFHNLDKAAKVIIEDLRKIQEAEAENMINNQFKMEQHIYAQDKIYWRDFLTLQKQNAITSNKTVNELTLGVVTPTLPQFTEITRHVKAYCSGAFLRLSSQIPMIIYYYALHMYGDMVERKMLQILQDANEFEKLLEQQPDLVNQRKRVKHRIQELRQARTLHQPFEFNFMDAALANGIYEIPIPSSTADLPFSFCSDNLANGAEELPLTQPTAKQCTKSRKKDATGATNTSINQKQQGPSNSSSSGPTGKVNASSIRPPTLIFHSNNQPFNSELPSSP